MFPVDEQQVLCRSWRCSKAERCKVKQLYRQTDTVACSRSLNWPLVDNNPQNENCLSYFMYKVDWMESLFHAVILNVISGMFTLLAQLFVMFHPRTLSDSIRSALF